MAGGISWLVLIITLVWWVCFSSVACAKMSLLTALGLGLGLGWLPLLELAFWLSKIGVLLLAHQVLLLGLRWHRRLRLTNNHDYGNSAHGAVLASVGCRLTVADCSSASAYIQRASIGVLLLEWRAAPTAQQACIEFLHEADSIHLGSSRTWKLTMLNVIICRIFKAMFHCKASNLSRRHIVMYCDHTKTQIMKIGTRFSNV